MTEFTTCGKKIETIKTLIISIDELIALKNHPSVDFELLYDVVFATHSECISPIIEMLGMKFDWCDPDTSYEEDVEAYLNALDEFKKRLQTLVN